MKVGDNEVKDILIGDTQVLKVYRGEDVIWERGGLPSGYRQVEYLYSDGNQWIDTGVIPNSTTDFYLDFLFTGKSGLGWLISFGCVRSAAVVNGVYSLRTHTAYGYITFQSGGSQATYVSRLNNKNIRVQVEKRGNDLYFNGDYVASRTDIVGAYQLNIYLFTAYDASTGSATNNRDEMIIYRCKISNNDILQRDFIPCLDPNNRPCMFDLVTKQPFYNQGTGEFLYGNII
jgi:hypothetical protein